MTQQQREFFDPDIETMQRASIERLQEAGTGKETKQ